MEKELGADARSDQEVGETKRDAQWLASFYQGQAQAYYTRAEEARERYATYSKSWAWKRTSLPRSWLDAWDTFSVLSEAYALTSRVLMGVS